MKNLPMTCASRLRGEWSLIALASACPSCASTRATTTTSCTLKAPTLRSKSDWSQMAKTKLFLTRSKVSQKLRLSRACAHFISRWRFSTIRRSIIFSLSWARLSRSSIRKRSALKPFTPSLRATWRFLVRQLSKIVCKIMYRRLSTIFRGLRSRSGCWLATSLRRLKTLECHASWSRKTTPCTSSERKRMLQSFAHSLGSKGTSSSCERKREGL